MLQRSQLRVCDCRFNLADHQWGLRSYRDGHIPGAVYVDLERDLSGPPLTDHGRHPMPSESAMVELFSRLGIDAGTDVVVYDQREGATASRAWWMLQYMGHTRVQVLNGGYDAWCRGGHPVSNDEPSVAPRQFRGHAQQRRLVTLKELSQCERLFDARDPRRYRGEVEPLDPIAGHIPGARNLPFMRFVAEDGRLLESATLRSQLLDAFAGCDPAEVVYSCGSGVTACHLALCAHVAGLDHGRLYGGSYSEWCRVPGHTVATGDAPGVLGE